uniref:Immunoglobulin C1-set domain-containing protein n=1 Tax=Mustela putorius furo TaxID=9669 RepID=M3Z3E9_MUSPF
MKTKDTYMKFSWLTVTGASMDKEHKCIVNHESGKKVVQEILFPSVNKGFMAVTESEMDSQGHSVTKRNIELVTVSPLNSGYFSPDPMAVELAAINSTKSSLNDENDTLQLQLGNTSVYYTYLLLLLKSLVYSIIIVICLLGRPELSGSGKSS